MTWTQSLRITLPREPSSARAARAHVSSVCRAAAMAAEMLDAVVLLTSELVTNAVLHGHSDARVTIEAGAHEVRVSVWDADSRRPVPRPDSPDALGGRGLHLVEALATEWGVLDQPTGKIVWFRIVDEGGPPAR